MNSCPLCACTLRITTIGGKNRLACLSCEFVHWDNPTPVTATLVPMGSGLVLVQRKFEPFIGSWCLPGGFIEADEDPQESAIREVLEETGLTVEIERLLGAHTVGKGINVIILFYLAKPAMGTLKAGDDASNVRSYSRDELPSNIAFKLHRQMIDNWFDNALSTFLNSAATKKFDDKTPALGEASN